MKTRLNLRVWIVVVAIAALVAGCSSAAPASTADADARSAGSGDARERAPGGLDSASTWALGTLRLEGTGEALTPAQAAGLLPLWQAIESGSLQGSAETDAVIAQIAALMTASQRTAIEAMALTRDDVQGWMQERGIEMPSAPQGQGGPGALQDLSEDERAKVREGFQNMTQEERATRMAEMGIQLPEGGFQRPESGEGARSGGVQGTSGYLFGALIELLSARATA